ncbi:hypothetical protein [Aeromicrobium sp. UC242_57]|uniref:hypothetical protein n=1 Tax=Aeromicrobium sp. UC242_57 TaxID=3374624 RepID=UPI003789D039
MPHSFAPTVIAVGDENRTCALRLVGSGLTRRVENRVPGADANPYVALGAMAAAGATGIEAGLSMPRLETGGHVRQHGGAAPGNLLADRDRPV